MSTIVETLTSTNDTSSILLGSQTKDGFATVQATGTTTPWSVDLQASVYDAEAQSWEVIGSVAHDDTKPKLFTFRTLPNVNYRLINTGTNEVRVRLSG